MTQGSINLTLLKKILKFFYCVKIEKCIQTLLLLIWIRAAVSCCCCSSSSCAKPKMPTPCACLLSPPGTATATDGRPPRNRETTSGLLGSTSIIVCVHDDKRRHVRHHVPPSLRPTLHLLLLEDATTYVHFPVDRIRPVIVAVGSACLPLPTACVVVVKVTRLQRRVLNNARAPTIFVRVELFFLPKNRRSEPRRQTCIVIERDLTSTNVHPHLYTYQPCYTKLVIELGKEIHVYMYFMYVIDPWLIWQ